MARGSARMPRRRWRPPPIGAASQLQPGGRPEPAPRTIEGHCSAIRLADRILRTRTSASTDAATSAATIQSNVSSPSDGNGSSRASDVSAKTSSVSSSAAWTAVLAKESIAPAATEVAAERPWRWKKRMLTAIRARLEGSATFMYPVASCIA